MGQQARARFRCCCRDRHYRVPSRTVIREVLTRVDPDALSGAVQRWNLQHADDEALAIDGKTMCNAVAATIQRLARNVRLVFDDLRMTKNSRRRPQPLTSAPG